MDSAQVDLNSFQERVEQRLNVLLKELGLQVASRRVGREEVPFSSRRSREAIVHVRARALEVRIREESVSFEILGKGDYYEMQDYENADRLVDAFLNTLRTKWSAAGGNLTDAAGRDPA